MEKADCLTGTIPGGIVLKEPGRGMGKRRRFVFEDRASCYHVMSRVAGGDLLFGDVEKEAFRKLMRRMERFSGVEILTYVMMGNHFHLLVRVPERAKGLAKFSTGCREVREQRLMSHLKLLYSKAYLEQLDRELRVMEQKGLDELYEKTMQGYLDRMFSLERFMKELKERFSRWFNKRHERKGTLWQERYRSILVQDGEALRTIAAYIDLNPLRAGLVDDPKDYRWCGYAEAVAGSKRARIGICRALGVAMDSWEKVGHRAYRRLLLVDGMMGPEGEMGGGKQKKKPPGFNREAALKKLKDGEPLSRSELLRCKVRYFSEGLVLGGWEFVESAFRARRHWFGKRGKGGAHALPDEEGGLFTLRNLLKSQSLE